MELRAREHRAVLGIFTSRPMLENAVVVFKKSGFRSDDISVLLPAPDLNTDIAHTETAGASEETMAATYSDALLDCALGGLAGIWSLTIPGVGPIVAAGPIVGALAAAGTTGSIGGLEGALIGLGFPEYEAKRYEKQVKNGGLLLSVQCDDIYWEQSANKIMQRCGAQDISSIREKETYVSAADDEWNVAGNG